ncbi:MAG: methylated-DNA--[protein]-cysteine S-methyltransferase [Proteobacteria bacterium]|nr:methylated-DNA--[protein]-cysteine S-methyltransferase [Pseudomonadota bacterium]
MRLIVSAFKTPWGYLKVKYDEHYLYTAAFDIQLDAESLEETNQLTKQISNEIDHYFQNPKHLFNLPLKPEGSTYQKIVWNRLLAIPSGQTLFYGDLSHHLKSSPRAIGQACKKNPIALFIPCHRVIAKEGMGGYMGNKEENINIKFHLLRHEGKLI